MIFKVNIMTGEEMTSHRIVKSVIRKIPGLKTLCRVLKNISELDEPKDTQFGFKLSGDRLIQEGIFEWEEIKTIEKLLPTTEVFIDIGANIGAYCCIARKYKKYLIAFEPIQSNLKYLYNNLRVNGYEENAEIYPIAVGDKVGLIDIYGEGTAASLVKGWAGIPNDNKSTVPISTIDIILGNRFEGRQCFVIMDVEGAERYVLNGAKSLFNLHPKPYWVVEISINEHLPDGQKINPHLFETFNIFWNLGYEAFTIGKGYRSSSEIRIITEYEIRQIVESGKDTIQVHNFLFLEKGLKEKILTE